MFLTTNERCNLFIIHSPKYYLEQIYEASSHYNLLLFCIDIVTSYRSKTIYGNFIKKIVAKLNFNKKV